MKLVRTQVVRPGDRYKQLNHTAAIILVVVAIHLTCAKALLVKTGDQQVTRAEE